MTEPEPTPDPVWAFVSAVPPQLRNRVNRTERLVALVHKAVVEQDWTPTALARYASQQLNDTRNAPGVLMHRLEKAAETRRSDLVGPVGATTAAVPFCSDECRQNAGWRVDEDGRLTSRCPCRTPTEANA